MNLFLVQKLLYLYRNTEVKKENRSVSSLKNRRDNGDFYLKRERTRLRIRDRNTLLIVHEGQIISFNMTPVKEIYEICLCVFLIF